WLSNSTVNLGEVTLAGVGNATNTLLFTNWSTKLTATNVYVNSRGNITHAQSRTNNAPLNTNRVWIVCTNLAIATNGSINVSGQGHWAQQGPGAAVNGSDTVGPGASHGGKGGDTSGGTWQFAGPIYGMTNAPFELGSSGGNAISAGWGGGAGGGAIWIEAATVTVNGTLAANGSNSAGFAGPTYYGGGGSGGSIYIGCGTFGGSTNGLVSANGGNVYSGDPGSGRPGGGGGGRIAVIYTNVAADTAVRFSVAGGSQGSVYTADFGTLYFPDTALLSETLNSFISGWIVITNLSSWSVNNLTVSNASVAIGAESLTLTVTNNLVIGTGVNSAASVILGYSARTATTTVNVGNSVTLNGGKLGFGGKTWSYPIAAKDAPAFITIGGNLTLTNGGSLWVYSGITNATWPDYGALVIVTGNISLATNTWIYPHSNPTNGGSALFRLNDLLVPTNAGFNADSSKNSSTTLLLTRGYYGHNGPGVGNQGFAVGPGTGYGGQGGACSGPGAGGPTYGYSNAPVSAGSGGVRSTSEGGPGGGVVRLDAANVTLNGTITADGSKGAGVSYGGGGSGGSVYLRCRYFGGGGLLSADGGNGAPGSGGNYPGGGGGGRIAVWSKYWQFTGTTTVTGGLAAGYSSGSTNGQPGTLFWGQLPLPGTIIKGL
ncbi:MAG: hypothetical protein HYV36_07185, partial [Lentisphaerae bacterium]|nr:hypothetical protein [Lentisphaerota bacterium]